jgi:hypothetical protein
LWRVKVNDKDKEEVLTLAVAGGTDANSTIYAVSDFRRGENDGDTSVEDSVRIRIGWNGRHDGDGSGFAVDVDGDSTDACFPEQIARAVSDWGSIVDGARIRENFGGVKAYAK